MEKGPRLKGGQLPSPTCNNCKGPPDWREETWESKERVQAGPILSLSKLGLGRNLDLVGFEGGASS